MLVALLAALQASAVERAAAFQAPRVTESSGVVASHAHPGVLWTHNDSGDGPYLYATALDGRDGGALLVAGAEAVDWEDLALGPCPPRAGAGDCLFIGDTGDNFQDRPWVTVYALAEPAPPRGPADTGRAVGPAAELRLRYVDGPRDVEALYVSPRDSALYLVSKGRTGPIRLYRVAPAGWGADTVVTAALVQTLPIEADPRAGRWVTAAAIRADGGLVAIRTEADIFFFTPGPDGRLAPADRPACPIGGLEQQGEGMDFLDEARLVLASEGAGPTRPGLIHAVRCPDGG
jgi:hypothetical protein